MSQPLWQVAIRTSSEAEEAVTELLASSFEESVSSYTDLETRQSTVSVYLPRKPAWHSTRRRLGAGLAQIARCGLSLAGLRVWLRKVPAQDWRQSWKRHFRPVIIGSKLLVRPAWSRQRARTGQRVIILNPGLSFGTGHHPTTSFCLRQIARHRRPGRPQSLLDIGTGSGILAIAAAKLGYQPIHAFDVDPESIRVAARNARRNRVEAHLRFRRQDLARLPDRAAKKYSLVCANLVSDLLIQQRKRIVARLAPDGLLVVAGILKAEFASVKLAYAAAGLRMREQRTDHEWRSAAFGWKKF